MTKESHALRDSILASVKPEDRDSVLNKLKILEQNNQKIGYYIPWGLASIPIAILIFLGFCIWIGYKAAGVL